jgi:hypothetical protein
MYWGIHEKGKVLLGVFLFFTMCLLSACGGGGGGPTPDPEPINAKWTIITYLDGNIDLDERKGINQSFILDVLQDFEDIGSTEDIQIVALYSSYKENGVGRTYHVEYYPNDTAEQISSPTISEHGTVDMSDYRTLRDLIDVAVDDYPADRYIFLGTGHGGGWRGIFSDEIQNSKRFGMSMDELAQAISESKVDKFDVMIFNACLMSMVEVGYQLRNLTDYIVASQVSLSADNVMGQSEWLHKLNDHPDMSPKELAESIALASYNEVMSRNIGDEVQNNHSISALATDEYAFETLASKWMELHNPIVDNVDDYYKEMFDARNKVHDAGLDRPDYIDIILYLEQLKQQPNISSTQKYVALIDDMLTILKEDILVIVYNNLNQDVRRGGIAVYFPAFCEDNTDYDQNLYDKVDFDEKTGWGDIAKDFVDKLIDANILPCNQPGDEPDPEIEIEPNNGTEQAQEFTLPVFLKGRGKHDPNEGLITITFENGHQTVVEDVFKFSLANQSNVSMLLSTNNQADFDLYLTDLDLNIVSQSIETGSVNEFISLSLQTGTYFILVDAWESVTSEVGYFLKVKSE